MAAPTEKEYGLLAKFRASIKDVSLNDDEQDDMFLLRWIRARENDLSKAEDMLRKSLAWRELNDMANIFNWKAPEIYKKEFTVELTGHDSEGSPIGIFPLGGWDVRKIIELGHRETYIRFVDQIFATMFEKLKETEAVKKNQSQFVIIIDLKGLTIRQFTSPSAVETVLETFRRFEANFPETLKTAYIINAPRIFPMAFAIVKPLLSGRTLQKIQIYNSNVAKWRPILMSNFPAHALPAQYGGSYAPTNKALVGTDCNCNTTSTSIDDAEGLLAVTVAAGEKLLLEFDVESVNSILRWEFKTDHFDIGFSIIYGENKEDVYAYERYDSHTKKAEGSLICERAGIYTFVFDNSYSRLRSKTLRYMGTVSSSLESDASDDADAGDDDCTSL